MYISITRVATPIAVLTNANSYLIQLRLIAAALGPLVITGLCPSASNSPVADPEAIAGDVPVCDRIVYLSVRAILSLLVRQQKV
jgi:hypothetical protein